MGGCCITKSNLQFAEAKGKCDIINLLENERNKLNKDLIRFSDECEEYFYIQQCLQNIEEFLIMIKPFDEKKLNIFKNYLQEFFKSFYDHNFEKMRQLLLYICF